MKRRTFVRTVGATGTVLTAGLAGCSELSGDSSDSSDGDGGDSGDDTSGERAPYDKFVLESGVTGNEVGGFTIDIETFSQGDDGSPTPTVTAQPEPEDPLLTIPLTYTVAAAFFGFALSGLGVASLLQDDGPSDQMHLVEDGAVFEGSFTTDDITGSLESNDATMAEDYGGASIYTKEESGQTRAVAVSEETVIFSGFFADEGEDRDWVARAKALVDATEGEGTQFSSTNDAFDELVTSLPKRGLMTSQFDTSGELFESTPTPTPSTGVSTNSSFTTVDDLELQGNALGLASSTAFDESNRSVTSSIAIRYESASAVDDESTLKDELGYEGEDRSVTIEEDLAIVEATFTDESLSQ